MKTKGVGTEVKHAPVVTKKKQENMLWEHSGLDLSTPLGLLPAIFYSSGKVFCLCGGKEHRKLKVTRYSNPDRFIYDENGSKNRTGGFFDLKIDNKIVPIYHNAIAGDRCHVKLLDLYLSKLPEKTLHML